MASWYSKIYVYVREYRSLNPILGFFLNLLLYLFLFLQFGAIVYAYIVYTLYTCGIFLTSPIQITIYLIIYNSLLILLLWSLFMTVITPVSKVPPEYFFDAETDRRLKELTPRTGERYHPDRSTIEQINEQKKILDDFAAERNLTFVEVLDSHHRLRYCYQCSLIKPDRSHHCSSCGFCVLKFDHHCPWINKCVSHRNYKYFMLYLFYGVLHVLFDVVTSLEAVVRFAISDEKELKNNWDEFIMVAISIILHIGFSYYPIGELLKYHAKLIWDNETTCEQAKQPIIRGGDSHASYNITSYRNYRSVFGWGLWAFPVPTFVSDGSHFHVRYSEDYSGERYEVVQQQTLSSSKSQHIEMTHNGGGEVRRR